MGVFPGGRLEEYIPVNLISNRNSSVIIAYFNMNVLLSTKKSMKMSKGYIKQNYNNLLVTIKFFSMINYLKQ